MAGLPPPDWFTRDCDQTFRPGIQLVSVQRSADDTGLDGRMLVDSHGVIWIPAAQFSAWTGYRPPIEPPRQHGGDTWRRLGGVPHHADACLVRLQIARHQPVRRYQPNLVDEATAATPTHGVILNLDLFGRQVARESSVSALTELGISTPQGYLRTREVFRDDGPQRLDTQFRHDLTDLSQTVILGDQVSSNRLGGLVRYGGISWGSDFSQQPELPLYPLPRISGNAALPSTAELYVDGQLRQRQGLAGGPFLLGSSGLPQGAGTLDVITRDALGREVRSSQPFYISPQLLRPGLDEFHVDLGRLRNGFGSGNDSYGSSFGSMDWRSGIHEQLTAGLHADLQGERQSLQAEALTSRLDTGLSQLLAGLSRDRDAGAGFLLGASQEWRTGSTYLQGGYRYGSAGFAELGREPGAIAGRATFQAGQRLGTSVQASLGWTREQRRDREDIEIRNLGLQYQPRRDLLWTLTATGSPQVGWTRSIGVFSYLPSWHQSVLLQCQQLPGNDLAVVLQWRWQPPDSPWTLQASGSRNSSLAGAAYNGPRGLASLNATEDAAGTALQGSLSTGLAWVPGQFHQGRRINDSLLMANAGASGITVYREHQSVGVTDADGRLMISDLLPYVPVTVALDAANLPLTAQAASLETRVRPPRGIGILPLSLPKASWQRRWRLRLDDGQQVPAGSQALRDGVAADLPVGLDGLLYLPDAWTGSALLVRLPDERQCHVRQLPPGDGHEDTPCVLQP